MPLASERGESGLGGEAEGRVPILLLLSLGVGDVPLVLFAQLWTLRPNLTCLLKVAEPKLQSLIPWERNGPWQGFCFPAP